MNIELQSVDILSIRSMDPRERFVWSYEQLS